MVSTLIGPTPADWTENQLGNICELMPGATTFDDPRGSVPVVKPKNLVAGKVSGPSDRVGADVAERQSRYQVRTGDLLCARTGTIGRLALVTAEQSGWIFGTGLIRIRPSREVDSLYLSLYLTHPGVQDWISRNAVGTAIRSINTRTLGSMPVSLPPLQIQRAIGQALDALNEKIAAHERICKSTAELRDALLPLLFSGRVTVSAD